MPVSVHVKRLGVDPRTNTPVVVLAPEGDEREFPIWIGPGEAAAIAVRLEGKAPARPLTHDLMVQVIAGFGGVLERVAVDRVVDGTIFARLFLARQGQTLTLDARPSDAIAAALRTGAEIQAAETLLEAPRVSLEPFELRWPHDAKPDEEVR